MRYPSFFDEAPRLILYDPLSAVLGATEDGLVEYTYLDAVKLAGHSCPTVAGAYLMTLKSLKYLYGGDTPVRGDINVELRHDIAEGVTGVIASVASLVTGAAGAGGFKGLAGRFERFDRLSHGSNIDGEIQFRRRDTGAGVAASMNPAVVPLTPETRVLLQRVLGGQASLPETSKFQQQWQERIRMLLIEHADDPSVIQLRPAC